MNNTKRLIIGSVAVALTGSAFLLNNDVERTYVSDALASEEVANMPGHIEYFYNIRKNQDGEIPIDDVVRARQQAMELANNSDRAVGMLWNERGPNNIGGRTRDIIICNENSNWLITGGVSGGLWFSETGGQSWWAFSDNATMENITVNSIVEDKDGYVYFGTGEGMYTNYGTGSGGFKGAGIWKSDQKVGDVSSLAEMTFQRLASTWTTSADKSNFVHVNKLETDPATGRIYAACARGLRYSDDGGATWVNPLYLGSNPSTTRAYDVDVCSDGSVFAVSGSKVMYSDSGDDGTYVQIEGVTTGDRTEVAVSPEDPNYVYIVVADGSIKDSYYSTDKGQTLTSMGQGGSDLFNPLGTQGSYNLALEVFPTNKRKIILGGVELWTYEIGGGWTRIGSEIQFPQNPYYVHSDKHSFKWDPNNPNKLYITSDGGIGRSLDGATTFHTLNKGYAVTQMYSVAFSSNGKLLGGTQDNSNQYLDGTGNTPNASRELFSGDGAYTAISHLNPEALYVESQYGNIARSSNGGSSFSSTFFEDPDQSNDEMGNSFTFAGFVAPFRLWEKKNDVNSIHEALFVAEEDYNSGDTVYVASNIPTYSIETVLSAPLNNGDSLYVTDPFQSKFFFGITSGLWMTREALDFSITPSWIHLSDLGTTVTCIEYSEDGDVVYYGDSNGGVYRVGNLTNVTDSITGDLNSADAVTDIQQIASYPQRYVTGIGVDPNDKEHVVITLGGYSNTNYVYESTNAASTTSSSGNFTSIQGNLPESPMYDALISKDNSNLILVTGEHGVYGTTNGSTWTAENDGLANVPTLMIAQQLKTDASNYGMVYIGTHGRGMFESASIVGFKDDAFESANSKTSLDIFPNPIVDDATVRLELTNSEALMLTVYDMTGRAVKTQDLGLRSGKSTVNVSFEGLSSGSYLVEVKGKSFNQTASVFVK